MHVHYFYFRHLTMNSKKNEYQNEYQIISRNGNEIVISYKQKCQWRYCQGSDVYTFFATLLNTPPGMNAQTIAGMSVKDGYNPCTQKILLRYNKYCFWCRVHEDHVTPLVEKSTSWLCEKHKYSRKLCITYFNRHTPPKLTSELSVHVYRDNNNNIYYANYYVQHNNVLKCIL